MNDDLRKRLREVIAENAEPPFVTGTEGTRWLIEDEPYAPLRLDVKGLTDAIAALFEQVGWQSDHPDGWERGLHAYGHDESGIVHVLDHACVPVFRLAASVPVRGEQ